MMVAAMETQPKSNVSYFSKINEDQATHGWLHDDYGKSSDARESQKLLVMCEDDFNWP